MERLTYGSLFTGGRCTRKQSPCRVPTMPKGVYERKDGKPRGRPKKEYPEELVTQVRSLYEAGHTQDEIGAQLGLSQKVIWKLMINHDIPRRPRIPRNQSGANNGNWKGNKADYAAMHKRVEAARGKPAHCSVCDTTKPTRYEWANLTGRYDDMHDYVRMCVSCHRRFDHRRRGGDA